MTKNKPKTASAAALFGAKKAGLVHSVRVEAGSPINTDPTVKVPDYGGGAAQPVMPVKRPAAAPTPSAATEGNISVRISPEHAHRAAYAKSVLRRTLKDIVEEALEDWFAKNNVPQPPTGFH